jgi:hypothetical protein
MKCLLKLGDVAVVVRPRVDFARWNGNMAEEFYQQGDVAKVKEMSYTSYEKEREHINRKESILGFVRSVCLPLSQIVARAVPYLKATLRIVKIILRSG